MVKLMFVDNVKNTPKKKPESVWRIVSAGFDRVTANPLLIVPPLMLDIFLWIGPRLTSTELIRQVSVWGREVVDNAVSLDPHMFDQAQVNVLFDFLQELSTRINFFWGLSNLPVSIPSSMVGWLPFIPGRMPATNPLGALYRIDLPAHGLVLLIALISMSIIGLGFGTAYQRWIAQKVFEPGAVAAFRVGLMHIVLMASMMLTGAGFALLGLSVISMVLTWLLGAAGSWLATFFTFSIFFSVGIYFFFTPHGILAKKSTLLRAMLESFNIVRWNMSGTLGFILLAGCITYFTNWVWLLPEDQSWFVLLGLVGHAVISTTLVAASYVFYKDRAAWLEQLRSSLQAG